VNEAGRSAAPLLATARLRLRPFAAADAEQLHRLFLDPSVRRHLLDDDLVSAQWVADEIDGSDALFAERGVGLWSIVLIGEADVIGFAGFRFFHDPPELQLIYGLHPRHWGVGLATEAAWAVAEHAFARAGFDEVVASADTPNLASIEVMKRLGMRFDRRLEKGGLDTTYYRLRRAEFPARRG
jgi:ribosomal-protein-alanine N-acetyltransferase